MMSYLLAQGRREDSGSGHAIVKGHRAPWADDIAHGMGEIDHARG
jgi:hypothetical protein